MTRLLTIGGAILLSTSSLVFAHEAEGGEAAPLDPITKWKVINTAIFAILLGWFLWKFAPRFFNARSADIQKAIKDATGLKLEADYRYSEMDRKMAAIGQEINKLRQQAHLEWEREHDRLRREADQDIHHIHQNVKNEIEAFRLEASQHLRQQTARLALDRAEQRLRLRFAQGEPENVLENFIHLVERGKN
jgi:F-type H+-transporting ATPase subunit b